MTETDFAPLDADDAFTAEEQSQWDAMRGGESAPAPTAEPALAPAAAPAAGEAPAAPGEVVEPDLDGEDDETKNKGAFVRHGAFHQARERYKAEKAARVALEGQLAEMREKFTRGDERLRLLTEAARQPQAPQPQAEAPAAAPDPNEDIFGYAKHLEQQIADLRNGVQQETARQRQEREATTVVNDYRADLNRYAGTEPGFVDAFRFVVESRAAEYRAMGVPEAQIKDAVAHDEFQIAMAARQDGVSAAERIHAIAKARGFAPKAPEPAPAPAPPTPSESHAERAARVEAGQKGPGMSLSAAGGTPAGEVTAEMLANMSDEEFASFQKANGRKLRALMGA